MGNFYTHHVLHSLSIAKYKEFLPGTTVLDLGTGGGFPGIPLAIFFPEVNFYLIDGVGKGSARSVRGVNIGAAVIAHSEGENLYNT